MKQILPTNRVLEITIAVLLLGLPVLTFLLLAGYLDSFSFGKDIPRSHAVGALWFYGGGMTIAIACYRFRPRPTELIMIFISVLFGLGIFEIAGRIVRIPDGMMPFTGLPSKSRHHVMPANVEMFQGHRAGFDIYVKTNEDGLRTPYSRKEFLSHHTRIAIVGDSFTFGFQVPEDLAYPHQLEILLRQKYPSSDIAILNAGIISYSPILIRRQLEQLIRFYKPHIVLMMFDLTDIGDDYEYQQSLREGKDGKYFDVPEPKVSYYGVVHRLLFVPLLEGSLYPITKVRDLIRHVLGLPEEKDIEAVDPYYDFELPINGVIETNRFFIYRYPLEVTRPFFETSLSHIIAASQVTRSMGASFALIVSPRFQHWNPTEAPGNWESNQYKLNEPYQFEYLRFFDEARERVDFPIIDLLPDFRATDEYPLVFRTDPHWNAKGHRFVARVLARHIERLGLLSQTR